MPLDAARSLSAQALVSTPELFDRFPYGLALATAAGEIVGLNERARRILSSCAQPAERSWSCCELICGRLGEVLGTGCMSALALGSERDLPEVRIDLEGERLQTSAWITAAVADRERSLVLFHLRPGRPGDRRRRTRQGWHGDSIGGAGARLRVATLGRFEIEGDVGPINGEWLEQRPGQVLKLLVCERRRLLASDQISETLWPGLGPEEARNRLRFHVHALRDRLEPGRTGHAESAFIASRRGGYLFDSSLAWVDADEFEREAGAGLAAIEQGDPAAAVPHLERASSLYRGEFLTEDPYAEWALGERERLRELAAHVLQALVVQQLASGHCEDAALPARRLAELDPFDSEAQQLQIEVSLRRGRRSEAIRRYEVFRARTRRAFGVDPDFDLRRLEERVARQPGPRLGPVETEAKMGENGAARA